MSCGISTYDKWNFKPQISSIFHFVQVSDSWLAHILGVNRDWIPQRIFLESDESFDKNLDRGKKLLISFVQAIGLLKNLKN